MRRSWLVSCLINFFIASLMGLLLRLIYIYPVLGINYQFLLHGHSHVAMLGWVYLMLYGLIIHFFIPKEAQQKPVYNRLFWITQFSVVGMMFRFPFEGYALFSIAFSTLHIFCSYYFCRLVWKDARSESLPEQKMLKTALVFMLLSTLGVWCLGPAVGMLGKASNFYQIAIQFFLHFQFNGWFLFAVLALFFKQIKVKLNKKQFQLFYKLLVTGTILMLALPVSWYIPNLIFNLINGIGVLLQFAAFWIFIQMIRPHFRPFFDSLKNIEKIVYGFALFSLTLKIILQLAVLVPELAQISHQIRNWVIGFIHLTMLGIITGFLFAFILQNQFLNKKSMLVRLGIILFLIGYTLTELLLFGQGLFQYFTKAEIPNYYNYLFFISCCLPVGFFLILLSSIRSNSGYKFMH
ncbi:MAG: hypothetical protein ACI7YS_08180 [Flavobacterium sp.]